MHPHTEPWIRARSLSAYRPSSLGALCRVTDLKNSGMVAGPMKLSICLPAEHQDHRHVCQLIRMVCEPRLKAARSALRAVGSMSL